MALRAHWQVELKSPAEVELTREAWQSYSDEIGREIIAAEAQFINRCDQLRMILLDSRKRLIELRDEMD